MAFPTIPTVAAGRILYTLNTAGGSPKTFPNLSSLTKNAGDLLIAIIVEYDGNSTNAEFSSWGGGFTEFGDQATTTTMAIGAAWKISTGSETGTFTVVTADTSTNDSVLILMSIPGAHDTTAPEMGTIANGTSAAADPGAFNPAGWDAEDTLWIAVGGSGEVATTGSFTGIASGPANYTDYSDSGITADVVGGVEAAVAFRQLNAASEDVGVFSVDLSNARNSALLIAVRPAAITDARSDVSWAELEVPTPDASGQVSWSELEVPTPDSSGQVSWTELEVPDAGNAAQVSWAELEVPTLDSAGQVSWTEFEVPEIHRDAEVSWTELEVPDPRGAQMSWTELEVPDPPTYASYGRPFLFTAANWGTHTDYFEVYMRATAGTVYARLWNETDSLAVAGSTVSTASASFVRLRSAAVTLVNGKEYRLQFGKTAPDTGEFLAGKLIFVITP